MYRALMGGSVHFHVRSCLNKTAPWKSDSTGLVPEIHHPPQAGSSTGLVHVRFWALLFLNPLHSGIEALNIPTLKGRMYLVFPTGKGFIWGWGNGPTVSRSQRENGEFPRKFRVTLKTTLLHDLGLFSIRTNKCPQAPDRKENHTKPVLKEAIYTKKRNLFDLVSGKGAIAKATLSGPCKPG